MPTAEQKDFIVDNGLDANESIKIGAQTVTSLVDSAQVSTIAREPANASAIALAGGASSKAYDSAELLPTSGNDSGDFGYVASTNRLYLWNGSGWYNIALINTSVSEEPFQLNLSMYFLFRISFISRKLYISPLKEIIYLPLMLFMGCWPDFERSIIDKRL